MLLEYGEIQEQLDKLFLPLEAILSGCRLFPSKIGIHEIELCESELGVRISKHFRHLLLRYSLDSFGLGPVVFSGRTRYLATLIRLNVRVEGAWEAHWWGAGERPQNVILIASSDPYSVLLNNETDAISAFVSDDGWHGIECVVAADFELFFRGLGTLVVYRLLDEVSAEFASEVATVVGSSDDGREFWQWLSE